MKKTDSSLNKEKRGTRLYYEVWGDALNMIYFMKTIIIILLFVVIGLVLLLKQSTDKLPLVVKVDSLGRAEVVKDWHSQVYVSPPEIVNFTQTFIDLFTGYDYYTYDENFRKSFKMITTDYQKKMDEYLVTTKIVDGIKQAQYKSKVNIAKIDIVKDAKESVTVKVKGYRVLTSYLNAEYKKEIVFETDIVLKKVARNVQTPWGLLLDYYKETIFKE